MTDLLSFARRIARSTISLIAYSSDSQAKIARLHFADICRIPGDDRHRSLDIRFIFNG
jgi:hypothetical protein